VVVEAQLVPRKFDTFPSSAVPVRQPPSPSKPDELLTGLLFSEVALLAAGAHAIGSKASMSRFSVF
jgi:hypothetical protein